MICLIPVSYFKVLLSHTSGFWLFPPEPHLINLESHFSAFFPSANDRHLFFFIIIISEDHSIFPLCSWYFDIVSTFLEKKKGFLSQHFPCIPREIFVWHICSFPINIPNLKSHLPLWSFKYRIYTFPSTYLPAKLDN